MEVTSGDTLERQEFEPEMVLIPAGEFIMGSDPEKDKVAWEWEQPQHTLYLPDYYMAKTPVTNAQYEVFVQDTEHRPPKNWRDTTAPSSKKDHPVTTVSWHDVLSYCDWISNVTGKKYRLPCEAEWEKSARGDDGRIYPWGDFWDARRCNTKENTSGDTTPVREHLQGASPYGLLDVAGNVWEWTSSLYGDYPYQLDDGRENLSKSGGRVLRGGSFYFDWFFARCADRDWYVIKARLNIIGFRVACDP